jgi:hypothetical protein
MASRPRRGTAGRALWLEKSPFAKGGFRGISKNLPRNEFWANPVNALPSNKTLAILVFAIILN